MEVVGGRKKNAEEICKVLFPNQDSGKYPSGHARREVTGILRTHCMDKILKTSIFRICRFRGPWWQLTHRWIFGAY
jgi:hypothetical protein